MKTRVFGILQRIGRSFMLPIAVLPIAGLFLGIGSSLTNETTISSLHLEGVLGNGTFLHDFLIILTKVGSGLFNNLPLIFAAAVALGMAKKAKEVAVLSSIIAFFVMHTTISGMLSLNGSILDNQIINPDVLDGTITAVCGIMSLEMGVFGGIIVGLGVSYIHNRFYQIELPRALSFFEGERFIPIISTITFLFAAPLLFGVQVILAGSAYMVAHIFNIAVGLTFSGGLFDFIVFGVLQGNSKTSWVLLIPIGIIYFMLYYFSFKYLIKKFDLKTPGREIDNMKLSIFKNPKASHRKLLNKGIEIDKQSQLIVRGLGGRDNFTDLDCCITRLRATVSDNQLVNEGLLKQSGAAAVVMQGNGVQIIYGPKASSIKSKLDEYLINIPDELDDYQLEKETDHTNLELGNIVDGEVLPIEQAPDQIFSHKLLGDGVMIKPFHGLIVAPCDGEITMIYPTKHAIGMKLDNGYELLIHFGTDTVNLNGTGFEILVKLNQRVQKGDLIWNADLEYIKENALDESILLIFTNLSNDLKIEKEYGKIKSGSTIMKICN